MSPTESDVHKSAPGAAGSEGRDFALGVPGFRYADLHDARRLGDLAAAFDDALRLADADLFAAFDAYRRDPGAMSPVDTSRLYVKVARHLSDFVARLFAVEPERRRLADTVRAQDPIFAFKREFLQRRVLKKKTSGAGGAGDARVAAIRRAFARLDFAADEELATARMVVELMALQGSLADVVRLRRAPALAEAEAARLGTLRPGLAEAAGVPAPAHPEEDLALVESTLALLEDWAAARLAGPDARAWVSCRFPEDLDYAHLVEVERQEGWAPGTLMGPRDRRRRRDGFGLTDRRMSRREVLDQAHYCVLCHDRDKDSCSKGLRDKDGAYKKNPLGITLKGCPLDEKISEAHALAREGDPLAALAVICVDNPMCPGTGHRICNDCMKGCIYQKQEPVNIPQIETGVLTDVLALPYGFEIWSLLTRWNPLKIARPFPRPYNDTNVLVVGLGPAGYTLALHLVNEGFGVAGIDGLKIEPLPDDLTGKDGLPPRPVRDVKALTVELDERRLAGFGGVSEYGITVRWDKNFLTLIQLCLTRRRKARFYGGTRFGGTITLDDAWALGFDHVALAAGAGRPTIIPMKNNLVRGVRKASDFLMALQLTGAFKRNALANLEARLPAIIVGGGLTAIDSATELLAYYPVQVEKILERFEILSRELGEQAVWALYTEEERTRLREYLEHGRAVRAERARAESAGEKPDFAPLVDAWGGVSIAYRKSLAEAPAYRLNHEEVVKALEEGIRFVESAEPEEALSDENGALKAVVFKSSAAPGEGGSGGRITLPARTLLVAAGTSPNITCGKERPGTFALDDRGQFFRPHTAERGPDGAIRLAPAVHGGEPGFFTSYSQDGRLVSFFGDNHPDYAGNVVKAMASARDGFARIVALFAPRITALEPREQPARDARLRELFARLDDGLRARVVGTHHLTPTIIEVVVRAPMAARNFKPGQFFRLQNFEATAAAPQGHPLLMEPLALTGAWVDRDAGTLGLIALELGVSSRVCAHLEPGEEVVVMGPTGAPTEIPDGSTVLLAGGGLGNAVLFSIAREAKERGCRVLYFAGYKKRADLFKREEIEAATDVVVWSVDAGEAIAPRRPQDRAFVGNIVQAMVAYATGALGPVPMALAEADRIIAIGSDRMMAAVARARHAILAPHLRPDHVGIGSINSPMQCMMKEVCAQCLQKHRDPATGRETVVFSCFNQDQPLDLVDWGHLRQRLEQNTVQEKLANLWFDRLTSRQPVAAR